MRYPTFIFIALAVTACASAPTSSAGAGQQRDIIFDDGLGTVRTDANPGRNTVIIPATPDRTWDAIMSAYSLLSVEVKYLNRPAGELGNRDVVMSRRLVTGELSRYLDCGSDPFAGPQANEYPVRASLVTRMWPDGTGTKIETRFSGTMSKSGARATVHCTSTGALESFIAVSVGKLAGQPAS